jgi:hypothetical protein
MKAKYLTAETIPQTAEAQSGNAGVRENGMGTADELRELPGFLNPKSERQNPKQIRISQNRKFKMFPVGRSRSRHRQVLQALRAAEMAAWEANPPPTRIEPQTHATKSLWQLIHAQMHRGPDRESLLIFILAAAGLIALLLTLRDDTSFLINWPHFVNGIRNLLS